MAINELVMISRNRLLRKLASTVSGLLLVTGCGAIAEDEGGERASGPASPRDGTNTVQEPLAVSAWPLDSLTVTGSVLFEPRAQFTGTVGAVNVVGGAKLGYSSEVAVDNEAIVTGTIRSNRLYVGAQATVVGTAIYNTKTGAGTVQGSTSTPLALPLPTTIPALPSITPGTQDINVNANQQLTLTAGQYRDVSVASGSNGGITRLLLSGGIFQVRRLSAGNDTRIRCLSPCEIRVKERIFVDARSYIGPSNVAGLGPGNVEVFVQGTNAGSGPSGMPSAMQLGNDSDLFAYALVPNGTLRLGHRAEFGGKIVAKDAVIGFDNYAQGQQLALVTSGPNDQEVRETEEATFSVTASTPGLTYQWRRNGVNIAGATSSTYTTEPTTLDDSGDLFSVVVSNAAGSVVSESAVLSVIPCADQDLTCDGFDDDCDGVADDECEPTPPVAVNPPPQLPPPPTRTGCFVGTTNGWKQVNCTTEDTITEEFPVPEPAIESYANEVASPILLEYGEVDVTFSTFGEVRGDLRADRIDQFSVQANTNYFPRDGGKTGWVQFVIQTKPTVDPDEETKMAVCIWEFLETAAPYEYNTRCVGDVTGDESGGFDPWTVYRRPGSYRQFDYATVGGSVFESGGQRKIGMVARTSWFDPDNDANDDQGLYAVVMEDETGLADNWTAVGGGSYGVGNFATAYFTDTQTVNRILAGSCANASGPSPEVPWPGSCPDQPPLLPNTRYRDDLINTGESHNLEQLGSEVTLRSSSPDLVYTQLVLSSEGDCLEGAERVYVKDNPSDTGAVPSNVDGHPFWLSPDLFIVPEGSPVDPNAPAPPIVVAPGQWYDAYMRVNNDYSCTDVSGVKVRMHIADPSVLSTAWAPITDGSDYQPIPGGDPNGVTVPAGGSVLVGPFPFQAPASGSDGHKCVIGSLISDNQGAPVDAFDAPGSYQVAQRNLAFGECTYGVTNATAYGGWVRLTLSVDGALPSLSGGNELSWIFDDPTQSWYDTWLPDSGTTYVVSHDAGKTTVRIGPPSPDLIWMGQTSVTLYPVPLGSGVTVPAEGAISLVQGEVDTLLSLSATLLLGEGAEYEENGGSCMGRRPPPLGCGNGTVDADEECDDGNQTPGDGCDDYCELEPYCGDGTVDAGEECDDGNADNSDGCLDICVVSTGTGPFLERDGFLVIEAEHYSSVTGDATSGDAWNQVAVATASGAACMVVEPDNGNFRTEAADALASSARLTYAAEFETSGTYQLWVLGSPSNNMPWASNSCHAGVDGSLEALNITYPENPGYTWQRGTVTVSSTGPHTVNIYMREDGFIADKLILTTDASYTPTGIGQVESPRL